MIQYIPSEQRYFGNHGWLQTYHSFSFADYYDPSNMHFGNLRVLNDDIVALGTGFGMHPHRDMEIVTYVITGSLAHKDSMGHTSIIHAGEIQRMTAGTGIFHSEFNASDTEAVHFLQIWVMPREKGLTPDYEQRSFSLYDSKNQLVPFVSEGTIENTLHMKQDAIFLGARLDKGKEICHLPEGERLVHLFVIEGQLELQGQIFRAGDAARISNEKELTFKGWEDAHFLIIDMAP